MEKNAYEDLSGLPTSGTLLQDNPFDPLLTACHNDPAQLQARYDTHRLTRNAQQKATILDANFPGWSLDPFLVKLEGPKRDPNFVDPRNCIVLWARPPHHLRQLIWLIQRELQSIAPTLWLVPLDNLHMTTLELAYSLTEQQMEDVISSVGPGISEAASYTYSHRSRLIKPMIGYDSAGLALSFVPAAGEASHSDRSGEDDRYTYHHLRRDLYSMVVGLGAKIAPRYIVPSAHLTIARFITQDGFLKGGEAQSTECRPDTQRVKAFISKISEINRWLEADYWPGGDEAIKPGGEWLVGEEKGLEYRKGRLWYGGGERVMIGNGF